MIERRGPRARKAPADAGPAHAVAPKAVKIVAVTHDVAHRRSVVTLVWTDDPERKLGLPIAYGSPLEAVPAAAEAAIRALAEELATIVLTPA